MQDDTLQDNDPQASQDLPRDTRSARNERDLPMQNDRGARTQSGLGSKGGRDTSSGRRSGKQ
jgi:hypothetical protein